MRSGPTRSYRSNSYHLARAIAAKVNLADLTNHLFLWHLTPTARADRIAAQGFVPKGQPLQNHPSRAVWFNTSAFSFVERIGRFAGRRGGNDGYLVALPVDSLNDHWDGQVADEFTVFQPVPPDTILCRFPADDIRDRAALLKALRSHLAPDVTDQLARLATRTDVPWSRRTSAASTLMYLDRDRYEQEGITAIALSDGLPGADGEALAMRMAQIDFRFYHYFLRQYYFTYGERHVARALLTAAARRIGHERVFALCTASDPDPGHHPVARFIYDIRNRITRADLAYAVFELRVMRPGRPYDDYIDRIENWVIEQPDSPGFAPAFIATEIFHARFARTAVDLAARVLKAAHPDPYDVLHRLAESPLPQSRLGAARALRTIHDERAIPFLGECLDSRWKKLREEAVWSLGALGSEEALRLVRSAIDDKSVRIRNIANRLLA